MSRWMLDFDGVLADLDSAFVASVNKKFGTDYTNEDVTDWHFWRDQGKEIADFVWKDCFHSEEWFYHNVGPYPGVLESLADLLSDSATEYVCIVTARQRDQGRWIKEWLFDLSSPLLPLGNIPVFTVGHEPKIETCKRLDLNIIVDDKPDNLNGFNPLRTSLFLVTRPWNADYREGPYVRRVDGLQEAINEVMGVTA